mgnify:CR=1 FL=1
MERSKILVVDDEKLVRRMIARVLESEGMSIVEASNGLDAVQMAKAQPFDLIILDIIMEGIMEKPFMMEISVWMGWFIRIVHRIQDCWSIKMSIVRLGLCPMIRKTDR